VSGPAKNAIAVLGAGSWGTALAILLARNGWSTRLWGHDPAHMRPMAEARCNTRYLPDTPFPDKLEIATDLPALAASVSRFLIVVPSHAFRATIRALHGALADHGRLADTDIIVAWGTKGLEPGTAKLLSQVADEELGGVATAVISGPTFAKEVARGLPTAITAASREPAVAEAVADWLRCDHMRVYTNEDVAGVQLGGAIKNIMAIGAGISDGLGFGANARAALITRGLAELSRLGVAFGGRPETFMGLAGVGDLVLTCTDNQSRNRRVGLGLGEGRTLDDILTELGQEAEGVKTTKEVYGLAARMGVEMPITEEVYRVIYEGHSAREAVAELLHRHPRHE
jgi:glycerol-3-phosphate dehydrogenase (NAD(P)+)